MPAAGLDLSQLPTFSNLTPEDDRPKPGPIIGGLAAGYHQLVGLGGSAIEGAGKLVGSDTVANYGKGVADNQAATAARVGRPDLEIAPWEKGGASIAPWLEYQAAKMVPTLAGYGAATLAVPEAAVPAGLARLGAVLPEFLGGAGLDAGASFAARKAALGAGTGLGKFILGGGAFGGVTGFGQALQSADQKPGGATQADALQALAEAPGYAAAGLIEPGFLRGALGGAEGNIVGRVISRTLAGSAVGGVQSSMLTALDQTFRPDLTPQQKTGNIVDSFLTGASVGGVFGGVTGVRALKRAEPGAIDNNALSQRIDESLAPQQQGSPLGLPAPTAFTDTMGRTVVGSGGADVLNATPPDVPQAAPALFGPSAVPDRAAVPGSTMVIGRRGESGQFTSEPTGVEQPPVVPEDTSRSYRNMTDPELFSAANALANKGEAHGLSSDQKSTAQAMMEEIAFRRTQPDRNDTLTKPAVPTAPEAVEQPADQRGTGEQNSAVPASTSAEQPAAPASIQTRIDELTNGLRLPAGLKDKLASARSEDDIQNIVHDEVIVDGKGGKMRDALAQRTGVLDDQGRPTSLADEISARKTAPGDQAAPAADAAFPARWKQDVQQTGQKDPAVRALNPTSEADAQTQIYQALGDKGVKSDADGLEKIAQKYGVLDENKQLTPLALEIAKKEPIPTADAVKAAVAQGYNGAEASMFDKGVRATTGAGEKITDFGNTRAGEAYHAGAKWAEETNSVPSGALKKYEPSGHTGEVTDEQRALGQKVEVKKGTIPPEVRQGQLVNEAIDNAGLHPTTHEGEIAQLKSMVRGGDIDGAMKGLQRVQRGESLFEQPERAPAEPFKGETVTRGAPKKAAEAELVPTKAQTRAQAERAISKYELGKAVDAAHKEGAINDPTRASLTSKLKAGKLDEVREAIPAKFSGEKALRPTDLSQRTARRDMIREIAERQAAERAQAGEVPELHVDGNGVLNGHPAQFQGSVDEQRAQAVQHMLEGKNAAEVADLLTKQAPNGFAREVSNKIKSTMAILKQAGIDINFRIAHAGDAVPEQLREARGLTVDGPEGTTVWINGLDGPGATGLSYEVVQHEMLHAVTMQAISHVENTGDYSTRLGRAVKDLQSVSEAIQGHFSNRLKQGNLTELEQYIQSSNALDDPHEVLAYALSSPEFQSYLDTIDYTPKQTMWGRFVEAMRSFLGLGARQDSALNEVLRASEQIMSLTPLDKELDMAGSGAGTHLMNAPDRLAPAAVNDRVGNTVKEIGDIADRFTERADLKGKLLGAQLYWADRHHITEMFAKWFQRPTGGNPLRDVELHERQRVAINAKLTQPSTDVLDRYNKVLNADRKSGENVQRIMRSTEFPFDYSKSWKSQSEEVRKLTQLQGLHREYHDLWRSLSPDAKGVLSDFRALNDVQMLQYRSMLLHAEAVANPATGQALGLTIHDTPVDKYLAEQATFSPADARAWWMKQVSDQATALTNHIATETHGADKETLAAKATQYAPITDAIKETQEAVAKLDSKPYFHLPRFGQFFVDFKVRDQQALARIADVLDGKGFNGIISKDSDQKHVFMRLENAAQQKALAEIVGGMKTGSKDAMVTDWNVGRLSDDKYSAGLLNKGLDRLVQTIQNNPALDKEARDAAVAGLRKTILDLMPESAISRVMTHRDNVPGYDSNMTRGFAQRYKVGVDSLSGTVVAPKIAQAYTDMRGMIRDAQKAPISEVSVDQRNNMQRVVDELSRRQREMSEWGHNKYLDLVSRVTSAHYLGLSPAFGFVQLSQLGVVTLPELGSQYGFLRSAREIAKATPLAFKIMAQVFAEGKKVSLTRAMDAVVTRDALVKTPGVSARMADFLMNIVGSGHIDLGGQIRELVRAAEGSDEQRFDKTMRYATSIGYYSETMSRLIAAIATHNVNDAKVPVGEVADKARHILDESLFNFSPENWGRAFGKKGFLGAATPLATKFMQYTAQLTGKLYREAHSALGGDKQAQRFLVQHLGMMTVLAGTLGLPLVTAFAAAYDKLKDEFADEGAKPSDIRSDYREYMTHVFGKGVEPILDRGLSRAAGIDVSQRLGEQDILPFSRFIADRRNVKDSLSDLESRSWGAPTAMISAYAEGMSKISQGDLLGGLTAALPLGLANPLKAYRMANGQFVDARGNVLPMEPSTRDVVVQALGFNPSQKADYSERQGAAKTSAMLLNQQAAALRSQMIEAMRNNDTATMRDLAQKIAEFDRANPQTPASKGIASGYKRQIEQSIISTKTQQPLGVKPGTGRYTFGDIQFSNALGNQSQ